MVPSGLMAACRRAGSPTSRSPSLVNATKDGNAFPEETPAPSAEGMMTGRPPSITAAAEFEVPRSIPMTRPMLILLCETCSPARPRYSVACPGARLSRSGAAWKIHHAIISGGCERHSIVKNVNREASEVKPSVDSSRHTRYSIRHGRARSGLDVPGGPAQGKDPLAVRAGHLRRRAARPGDHRPRPARGRRRAGLLHEEVQ